MARVEVTRTYLEMRSPDQLRGGDGSPSVRVEPVPWCPAAFYRFLYAEVGRLYHWVDRSAWTDEEIRAHLDSPRIRLFVLYEGGAPAGYYELQEHPDGSTEIAYFGLLPDFQGRGLGRALLLHAAENAWRGGPNHPNRVWLHTCTLDGAAALPNYRARGFVPFKEEKYWAEIP
jgi:ribosomal protein S18 acetylase RimI-like enzyme